MCVQRGHLFFGDPEFFSFPANSSVPPLVPCVLQSSFVAATTRTGMEMSSENQLSFAIPGLVHDQGAVKNWEGRDSRLCPVKRGGWDSET